MEQETEGVEYKVFDNYLLHVFIQYFNTMIACVCVRAYEGECVTELSISVIILEFSMYDTFSDGGFLLTTQLMPTLKMFHYYRVL